MKSLPPFFFVIDYVVLFSSFVLVQFRNKVTNPLTHTKTGRGNSGFRLYCFLLVSAFRPGFKLMKASFRLSTIKANHTLPTEGNAFWFLQSTHYSVNRFLSINGAFCSSSMSAFHLSRLYAISINDSCLHVLLSLTISC